MDTTQKNREAAGTRRPREEAPKRRAAEASSQPRRREQAASSGRSAQKTAQADTARRQRPAQTANKSARQRPAQTEAQQRAQRVQSRQQPASQQTRQQHAAQQPRQQTARKSDMTQRTVHQGGPHQRAAQGTAPKQRPMPTDPTPSRREKEQAAKKNALQNFIAGVRGTPQQQEDRAEQARLRRARRAAQAEKKKKQAERIDAPAVIYTQPQTFNRNRLLVQLMTITAVVVALVIGLSVFFKVGKIHVAGAETYSNWKVVEASGIQEGDNLLTFSRARASAQIRAELPYVSKVRIGIKLPETVTIYIEELDVAYAIESSDGDWWLITSGGRVAEQITGTEKANYTQVLGVTIESPVIGEDAVAVEQIPTETNEAGELIPIPVTGSQRLFAALQILKALEANDIVGEAASVDVTRLEDVILWYGSRYQVNLGDTSNMEYKIACMNDAILQLSEYQSGILDISFTIWPDQVGYTPFG